MADMEYRIQELQEPKMSPGAQLLGVGRGDVHTARISARLEDDVGGDAYLSF